MSKRELKKVKNGYELITEDKENKLKTIKEYSKKDLKEIHKQLINGIKAGKGNISKLKAEIKKLGVEDSDELRELSEKMNKAQKLQKKVEKEKQLDMIKDNVKVYEDQRKELESKIPELKRND